MRHLLVCILCMGVSQPALGGPNPSYGGIVAGEAMCSLQRQGVSDAGIREEYNRITKNLRSSGLLLASDQPAYLKSIRQILSGCTRRNPAI